VLVVEEVLQLDEVAALLLTSVARVLVVTAAEAVCVATRGLVVLLISVVETDCVEVVVDLGVTEGGGALVVVVASAVELCD
jgi:hypothetical protein